MDLQANAKKYSIKRETEQNSHQETTNMDEEHTPEMMLSCWRVEFLLKTDSGYPRV